MRTEQQILDLILHTARTDERIRAVILNGSRADPDAPRDIFQDFDIVYLVTDMAPFVDNLPWLARFGELMIVQKPDAMGDAPPDRPGFAYLALFTDGNRIDLTFFPVDLLGQTLRELTDVGAQRVNLMKVFNEREGFTRDDDKLPPRLHQPLRGGISDGMQVTEAEIEWAKDLYYRMAGWDAETGNPTLERLEELGIAWAMG